MENFINLDKNMVVNKTIGDVDVVWHDVRKAPFDIYGLYQPQTEAWFHRLPMNVAQATNGSFNEQLTGSPAAGSENAHIDDGSAAFQNVDLAAHFFSVGNDLFLDDLGSILIYTVHNIFPPKKKIALAKKQGR